MSEMLSLKPVTRGRLQAKVGFWLPPFVLEFYITHGQTFTRFDEVTRRNGVADIQRRNLVGIRHSG